MPKPKRVASREIHKGRVISLRVDTIDLTDGKKVKREVVVHPGGVVIVPIDKRGRVLLVRQYRYPIAVTLLELPAGTLEVGEDPLETAKREIREETGFRAANMVPHGGFYTAPGFCTEYLHLYFAAGLTKAPLPVDDDEDIEVVPTPLADIPKLIESGAIRDAKSIAGLALYIAEREGV